MISAQQAFERLQEGNQRFISGDFQSGVRTATVRRKQLAAGQEPFAVVVGCSDSRVPLEIVFDQGLGDLFVIRVAGNIVNNSVTGSVEFAVAEFGTPLVVVLGHSTCGAITSAVNALEQSTDDLPTALRSIVEDIKPAVNTVINAGGGDDRAQLIADAVRVNVRASVAQLRRDSTLLDACVRQDSVRIIGAEYMLDSGVVEFFEAKPGNS